jgi:hypothetical protein
MISSYIKKKKNKKRASDYCICSLHVPQSFQTHIVFNYFKENIRDQSIKIYKNKYKNIIFLIKYIKKCAILLDI